MENKKLKFLITAIILLLFLGMSTLIWKNITTEYQKTLPIPGFENFLQKKDICSIAILNDDIWAGGINGLFVLTKTSDGKTYEEIEKGEFREVKALLADSNGMWVGHDDGLSFIEGEHITSFGVQQGLPDKRVNALEYGPDGNIWVGTWGGIAIFSDKKIVKTLNAKDGLVENMVNVIYMDSQNNMWIGSYVAPRGGITIITDKKNEDKLQYFTTQHGLIHANINAIIEIKEKIVLSGGGLYTKGGGTLFQTKLDKWDISRTITVDDGIAGDKIRALFLDSKNRLWVGSEYDGLAVFDDINLSAKGKITIMTKNSGLPNDEVKVIRETVDGDIWIGTRSGLLKIEKGGIEHVQRPD